MYIDAFASDGDLASFLKGEQADRGRSSGDIDIWADDCGIIASQFQRHTLQGVSARFHNFLAGHDAAREGNLLDPWVTDHPGAQFVVTAKYLEHTWMKYFLRDLDKFER